MSGDLCGDDGVADCGDNVDKCSGDAQSQALGLGEPVVDEHGHGDVHEEAAQNAGDDAVNGPLPELGEGGGPDIGQTPHAGHDGQDHIGLGILVKDTACKGRADCGDDGVNGHEEGYLLHAPAHFLRYRCVEEADGIAHQSENQAGPEERGDNDYPRVVAFFQRSFHYYFTP